MCENMYVCKDICVQIYMSKLLSYAISFAFLLFTLILFTRRLYTLSVYIFVLSSYLEEIRELFLDFICNIMYLKMT